ncbi:hypothetical protein [Gallionella capsiferriformans]|nr:hypothetical protein [Gallionella capsiferriformans]
MKNYAHRLANFLEWCDVRTLDPMKVEYASDLIGRYQKEMVQGIWSRGNSGLSERTINSRVDTAVEFLTWATDKGMRSPMEVATVTRTFLRGSATSSVSHLPVQVKVRKGKLRESKRRLGFPDEKIIAVWLAEIFNKELVGPTEGLICEMILETALRETEAACFRVDTLPRNQGDWKIPNPNAAIENQAVLVEVRYGTKGHEYGLNHGDKIGPLGTIRIPMPLALKLHQYRETVRPKALSVAIRQGRTAAEQRRIRDDTVHLFINPRTGRRYSGGNIYDIWRSVERPKGWSPHLARDFWACSLLWRRIEDQRKLLEYALRTNVDDSILTALQSNALAVIQLEIQPQLRHRSKETTMIYLQWLADRLGVNLNLHKNWVEQLSEGSNDEGECE